MNLQEIASLIKAGELIQHGDVLLTKEQHAEYVEATRLETYYDMLQGVRKVLL